MSESGACCQPGGDATHRTGAQVELGRRVGLSLTVSPPTAALGTGPRHSIAQALVPAQAFLMGDSHGDGRPFDGEGPVHEVRLDAFTIDSTSVTNADFAVFADTTGYVTDAERLGYSYVFHLFVEAEPADVIGQSPEAPWWMEVQGASWRHPGGGRSDLDDALDHPVVHISWNDAQAYCAWADRRLPTEAEWEAASRGGLESRRYPWGDELLGANGEWMVNIWQGAFPYANTRVDGHAATAPVHSYRPNAYGLWQTVGNVWEWCADWWSSDYYANSPRDEPRGPESGSARVLRGGSYLCHDSYCNRYRNSARTSNTADSSMGNAGFRTVSIA